MKKSISTILGRYYLAAETKDFLFYVNYNESDENAQFKMYRQTGELVSDNYFASVGFYEAMEANEFTRLSKRMKKEMKSAN